jgi:hypothetical protein
VPAIKNRSHSTKPIIPTFQYSNTPGHLFAAKPIICDLAQLPARRVYSPEGGLGFQCPNKTADPDNLGRAFEERKP